MLAAFPEDRPGLAAKSFDTKDLTFVGIATTTFVELEEQGLLIGRHVIGAAMYALTPRGWLEALRRGGLIDSELIRQRSQAVVRVLKASIKDSNRSNPRGELVYAHTAAAEAGVSVEWLHAAIESGLLQSVFPSQQIKAYWDGRASIRVPPTFGFPLSSQR
jgi:hypothetical protein